MTDLDKGVSCPLSSSGEYDLQVASLWYIWIMESVVNFRRSCDSVLGLPVPLRSSCFFLGGAERCAEGSLFSAVTKHCG